MQYKLKSCNNFLHLIMMKKDEKIQDVLRGQMDSILYQSKYLLLLKKYASQAF